MYSFEDYKNFKRVAPTPGLSETPLAFNTNATQAADGISGLNTRVTVLEAGGASGVSGKSGISGYSGYHSCATEINVTIVTTGGEVTILNPAGNYTLTTTDSVTWTNSVLTLHKVGGYWQLDYDDGDGGVCSFSTTNANTCPDTNAAHYSTVGSGTFVITFISSAGFSGVSGSSGRSGYSGTSGRSGTSGQSGTSGTSGRSGFSGYSGVGTSGVSGYSGTNGSNGATGTSGTSGYSGVGTSGVSGQSGASTSGVSGYSGVSGTSGTSGSSGVGTSGVSGTSGYSGSTDPLLLATTTSSVGQVRINNVRVLHSYGTGNFFVGTTSGNFTLSGQQNYFATDNGGASLSSGSYNTALGYQAMNAISTGQDNLAIGRLALAQNGSASVNLAIGNATLYQHTTGTNNVAVGGEACRNGSTHNSVTSIGYQAGYDTLGTGVTYIGRAAGYTDGSTATGSSLTNATALGYYAQVTASNSLVLGGTGSYLVKGGIGTATPNSRWHVNGSFATAYRAITALRTLDDTDHVIECTANTFTITLPAVSGLTGRQYIVKNTGAGTITLDGNASETIDGSTTQTVAAGAKMTIVCTGTAWISI